MAFGKPTPRITTMKEQVYAYVREAIISGRLKPGERIPEVELAAELNVSRSPIRDALNELAGEGLVETIPNKGVSVRRISEKEVDEIYDIRLLFERYAIEQAVRLAGGEQIGLLREVMAKLEECMAQNDVHGYCKADEEFHHALICLSGNGTAIRIMSMMSSLLHPFRVLALSGRERFVRSLEEHRGILLGIEERDLAKALESATTHLELASEEVRQQLREHAP